MTVVGANCPIDAVRCLTRKLCSPSRAHDVRMRAHRFRFDPAVRHCSRPRMILWPTATRVVSRSPDKTFCTRALINRSSRSLRPAAMAMTSSNMCLSSPGISLTGPLIMSDGEVGCQASPGLSMASARQGVCISGRAVEIVVAEAKRLISPWSAPWIRSTASADYGGAGGEDFRMGMPRNIRENVRLTLLLSRETVAALVKELALRLCRDNAGKDLLLLGVLKGDFVFLADLSRDVEIPVQVELSDWLVMEKAPHQLDISA